MNKTTISWTDFSASPIKYRDSSGKSVWGCVKCSPGCARCYSESLAKRWDKGGPFTLPVMNTLTPYVDEKEINTLLHSKKIAGKRVFLEDMSDLFGPWVPFDMIDRVFAAMALRPDVTFQILTKRTERMAEYLNVPERSRDNFQDALGPLMNEMEFILRQTPRSPFRWPLPNLWLGTSVEDQARADERIPWLLKCPAAMRFLSCEPLLGPIDLKLRRPPKDDDYVGYHGDGPIDYVERGIDWVIVGGESGNGARPCHVEWIRSIVSQCRNAGVPVWTKQDAGPRPGLQGRIPDDLWIHEMPI